METLMRNMIMHRMVWFCGCQSKYIPFLHPHLSTSSEQYLIIEMCHKLIWVNEAFSSHSRTIRQYLYWISINILHQIRRPMRGNTIKTRTFHFSLTILLFEFHPIFIIHSLATAKGEAQHCCVNVKPRSRLPST